MTMNPNGVIKGFDIFENKLIGVAVVTNTFLTASLRG